MTRSRGLFSILTLLSLGVTYAGAVVQISNLSQSQADAQSIQYGAWASSSFTTDNQAYDLDTVRLNMDSALNTDGFFTVYLYSHDTADGGKPGSLISNGTLTGTTNPSGDQGYNYTPSSAVTLSSNTTYWVVAAVSNSGGGIYKWDYTVSTSETGNGFGSWSIGDVLRTSSDQGSSWNAAVSNIGQFSIAADPIPEPAATACLTGIAVLAIALLRRRIRGSVRDRPESR